MKPMPPKARDLTIAGIIMGATALCWYVAPEAKFVAASFVAFGVSFVGYALYLWRRPQA